MTVFGIHCNFFIVLPIRLKTCRCISLLFFTKQNTRDFSGTSQRFCAPERHRTRNLSRPDNVREVIKSWFLALYLKTTFLTFSHPPCYYLREWLFKFNYSMYFVKKRYSLKTRVAYFKSYERVRLRIINLCIFYQRFIIFLISRKASKFFWMYLEGRPLTHKDGKR